MDDEDLGRLAKALLADLDGRATYEGRILTLARGLRHVEGTGAPERARLKHVPGVNEAIEALRALWTGPKPVPEADTPVTPAKTPKRHDAPDPGATGWSALARRDLDRMIATAPGPTTRCCRALGALASHAHVAAQWGQLEDAGPMLWACAFVLGELTEGAGDGPLVHVQLMCASGALAAERGRHLATIALARRAAADFGAISRAASRLEGRPELDPNLDEMESDTLRGLSPEPAARAAAEVRSKVR